VPVPLLAWIDKKPRYAACFARYARRVMVAMGLAVFSHFLLDLPMHPQNLALWPGSTVHVGLGLWRTLPTGFWFVELAVLAAGLGYYWHRSRIDGSFGAGLRLANRVT